MNLKLDISQPWFAVLKIKGGTIVDMRISSGVCLQIQGIKSFWGGGQQGKMLAHENVDRAKC